VRSFIDCEFLDDGRTIDLISIGLVAEDGREFYACNLDAELHRCHIQSDSWMKDNVLAQLPGYGDPAWLHKRTIRDRVHDFFLEPRRPGWPVYDPGRKTVDGTPIEIWGFYADYDWVAFCQLFGRMMDLPAQFPKFCRDLKQLAVDKGSSKHPPKPEGAHNALIDARWNRDLYTFLTGPGCGR
jgi:hypothetical protein